MDPASGNVQPAARGPRKGFPRGCWQDGKGEQPWLTWVIYGKKNICVYMCGKLWKYLENMLVYIYIYTYVTQLYMEYPHCTWLLHGFGTTALASML